jgi:hypothetical protein
MDSMIYEELFTIIRDETKKRFGMEWKSDKVITDYEPAVHSAIKQIFGKPFIPNDECVD